MNRRIGIDGNFLNANSTNTQILANPCLCVCVGVFFLARVVCAHVAAVGSLSLGKESGGKPKPASMCV